MSPEIKNLCECLYNTRINGVKAILSLAKTLFTGTLAQQLDIIIDFLHHSSTNHLHLNDH